jgi:hypothetical protein
MMGALELPPGAGSPCLRRCSSINLERLLVSRRGIEAEGLSSTSTWSSEPIPSSPKPSRRHNLRNRTSLSLPLPRVDSRAASQTSSPTEARSTPCSTSSRLNCSFSSQITMIGGTSALNASRSQPPISPLTIKPNPSRKSLTPATAAPGFSLWERRSLENETLDEAELTQLAGNAVVKEPLAAISDLQ